MRHFFITTFVVLYVHTAIAEKLAVMPTQFDESSRGQVPKLFDDYVLTAVQNLGGYEVIGQDDINALIGFEKQKDLFGCDDAACIADIGGALGVDRMMVVKIARLGNDWVSSCKIINIKATKVERRLNEVTPGDVRALLEGVPGIVAKLFGKTLSNEGRPLSQTPAEALATSATQTPTSTRDPESYGRAARYVGTGMLFGGFGIAVAGGLLATFAGRNQDTCDSLTQPDCVEPSFDRAGYVTLGLTTSTLGLVIEGIGAKIRANGVARRERLTDSASGSVPVYPLGWVLMGVSIVGPVAGAIADRERIATILGWGGGLGASAIWIFGSLFGVEARFADAAPSVQYAIAHNGQRTPLYGLALHY